jgi:hypothetical protein
MSNGSIKINQTSLEKGAKVMTGLRHQKDRVELQMKTGTQLSLVMFLFFSDYSYFTLFYKPSHF